MVQYGKLCNGNIYMDGMGAWKRNGLVLPGDAYGFTDKDNNQTNNWEKSRIHQTENRKRILQAGRWACTKLWRFLKAWLGHRRVNNLD